MVNANGNLNLGNFRAGFGEERIQRIAAEVQRRTRARKDFVAPRGKLGVTLTEDEKPRLALVMRNGVDRVLPFKPSSLRQLVGSLDVGLKFAESMTERGHLDLVAGVMNELLSREAQTAGGKDRKHLIRELDDEVDGLLSDSYRSISNETILTIVLEEAAKIGAEVWDAKLTDTHFEVDLIAPGLRARVENLLPKGDAHGWAKNLDKDFHNAACKIGNSENGHGRFYGDLGLWRDACRNLAIMQRGIARVHLGSKLQEGEQVIDWSDETKALEDEVIAAKLRDTIKTAFDPARFKKLIDSVSATTARTIGEASAIEVVDATIKLHKIDQARRDAILERFLSAGLGKTQYALAQAVTATVNPDNAKDAKDEERSAIEVAGGKLLALSERDWKQFCRNAVVAKDEPVEDAATQAVNVVRS